MNVQSVEIAALYVPEKRQRAYSEESARELARDIQINGLIHPITVMSLPDGTQRLTAGLHRVKAHEMLGRTHIDACVHTITTRDPAEIEARCLLLEISENLKRKNLSVVELSRHAVAHEIICEELGYRKGPGRPRKGEVNPPDSDGFSPLGNKEFARALGKGDTQYRSLKQIRKRTPDVLLKLLEKTPAGSNQEELRRLGKSHPLEQIKIAALLATGEAQNVRDARRSLERAKSRSLASELETPEGTYRTIVIDPPWDPAIGGDVDPFGKIAPAYATLTYEEIEALPVAEVADENCHLYLWCTGRTAEAAYRLARSWGFRPIQVLIWYKKRPGSGHYFRMQHEPVLFCVKGSQFLMSNKYTSVFEARRTRHSEKPDEFYDLVRDCSPGPRLEMFARRERDGFTPYGTLEYSEAKVI
jgi:N6-adenosine-specific RNA methylase IME4